MIAADQAGAWTGTNGFRLMPGDPLADFPATVTVSGVAGGHLLLLTYTWRHPDDGPQDGVLLIGPSGEDGAVSATWGDSWHQKPEPMLLTGRRDADGVLSLAAEYAGGWGWTVELTIGDAELRLRMDNVIPAEHGDQESPAGPYPVMVLHARQ